DLGDGGFDGEGRLVAILVTCAGWSYRNSDGEAADPCDIEPVQEQQLTVSSHVAQVWVELVEPIPGRAVLVELRAVDAGRGMGVGRGVGARHAGSCTGAGGHLLDVGACLVQGTWDAVSWAQFARVAHSTASDRPGLARCSRRASMGCLLGLRRACSGCPGRTADADACAGLRHRCRRVQDRHGGVQLTAHARRYNAATCFVATTIVLTYYRDYSRPGPVIAAAAARKRSRANGTALTSDPRVLLGSAARQTPSIPLPLAQMVHSRPPLPARSAAPRAVNTVAMEATEDMEATEAAQEVATACLLGTR
ncbi:hypothetical protein HK405_000355, partial [Cladochytrium tenue]